MEEVKMKRFYTLLLIIILILGFNAFTVVAKEKLIIGIRDMFSKQNQIMMFIIVICILLAISIYLGAQNYIMLKDTVLPALETLKSQVGTTIIQGV